MAQKHLKELLKEEQEPFHLKDYVALKQCQLQRTQTHLKKHKPISKNSQFLCFLSLQNSPDPRKSPLFDFTSPVTKSPNRVFLHVPAKTASLLLEAASRIQKPKTQQKNSAFGLLGSFLKRFTNRNRSGNKKLKNGRETVSSSSPSSSSSSSNERQSSLDLESSSSGRSFDDEEEEEDDGFEFANAVKGGFECENYGICLSPLSPFRFALHTTPSPGRSCSPVFCSPIKSPAAHCIIQENVKNVQGSPVKFQDEEDKEQNSPVSVLDPPFEDDDYDGHEDDSCNVEHSNYSFVQRERHRLLHRLHEFDTLSELDPIELEKRMIEEEDEAHEELDYVYESFVPEEQRQVDEFIEDIITKTRFEDIKKPGIKRLISDLIMDDSMEDDNESDEEVLKRVCKRLESWHEVKYNTIDMMVEIDLRTDIHEWKKPNLQIRETASDLEVAIFRALLEEFVEDIS